MTQASQPQLLSSGEVPLSGGMLWVAAMVLAAANFIAVLNLTLANVSVPSIAGSLGATTSQGIWVITSFAVGEAITVPLTGWLAGRFGSVRVFVSSLLLFTLFSALSGVSTTLGLLVVARIFQGFAAGPLMPLSQTLLLRIFPREKAAVAIAIWSMTTTIAPVLGPILGGYLCDEYSWHWVFFLNTPIAIGCAFIGWNLLQRYTDPLSRNPIDRVGLVLLVVWVAALQLMLDEGKDLDWFASTKIITLAIVAVVGFIAFLIWEIHEEHPVVDLRIFRHRGFSATVLTICLAFAAYFSINVLTPLWLQSFMGYTATIAGQATAWTGCFALFTAPIAAQLMGRTDPRRLVFFGVLWMGGVTLWRSIATTDMGFWDVATPLMALGLAVPFFFIPTMGLALSSVEKQEMDSAAGLMNFLRTLSGAIATSVVTTNWSDRITYNHAELVGLADSDGAVRSLLERAAMTPEALSQTIDYLITSQSVMLATNEMMALLGLLFIFSATLIWLAPRPARAKDAAAHGDAERGEARGRAEACP